MIVFIVWVILSVIIASYGSKKHIGYTWTLIISLVLSPLFGLIAVLISAEKTIKNNIFVDILNAAKKAEFTGDKDAAIIKYKEIIFEANQQSKISGKANRKKVKNYQTEAVVSINRLGGELPFVEDIV